LARAVIRFWLSTRVPSTSARRIEIFFEAIDRSLVELRPDFKEPGLFRIQDSGFRIQKPAAGSRSLRCR
jgi:hypothetical protein